MAQRRTKRTIFIVSGVIVAILVVIGIIAIINAATNTGDDPYKQTVSSDTSETSTPNTNTDDTDTPEIKENTTKPSQSDTPASSLDPETVSSLNIDPMSITVSYVKGIGGFEYGVMRTPSGTNYVEFYSPELAGTKCTDDQGAFASIIESPDTNEASTLNKKTTVDGVTYGLSLAASSCTSNPELLAKYQQSFSDAFTLLKKM